MILYDATDERESPERWILRDLVYELQGAATNRFTRKLPTPGHVRVCTDDGTVLHDGPEHVASIARRWAFQERDVAYTGMRALGADLPNEAEKDDLLSRFAGYISVADINHSCPHALVRIKYPSPNGQTWQRTSTRSCLFCEPGARYARILVAYGLWPRDARLRVEVVKSKGWWQDPQSVLAHIHVNVGDMPYGALRYVERGIAYEVPVASRQGFSVIVVFYDNTGQQHERHDRPPGPDPELLLHISCRDA